MVAANECVILSKDKKGFDPLAGSIWYPDCKWAEQVIDEVAKCRFDGTDESDDLPDTVVMMATYMRQRYKVEVVTDIDEDEEAEAAVK